MNESILLDALKDIIYWTDDMDEKWGDQGYRAAEAIKKWEDSSGKETGMKGKLLQKYETYYDNIEWHIRTNKPPEGEVKKLNRQLDIYAEIINDLKGESVPPYKEEEKKKLTYEEWMVIKNSNSYKEEVDKEPEQ